MGFLEEVEAGRYQRSLADGCPIRDLIDNTTTVDDDGAPLSEKLAKAVDGPYPVMSVARAITARGLTSRAPRTVWGWVADHRRGRCTCG